MLKNDMLFHGSENSKFYHIFFKRDFFLTAKWNIFSGLVIYYYTNVVLINKITINNQIYNKKTKINIRSIKLRPPSLSELTPKLIWG